LCPYRGQAKGSFSGSRSFGKGEIKVSSKKRKMLVAVLLILGVALSGCAYMVVGAVGATGAAYVIGEDRRVFAYNFDEVYDAALAAVKDDCKLPVYEEKREAVTGTITASLVKGTKVNVTVKFLSAGATEVRIRVGFFGDEDFSNMLFYKIEDRLRGIEPLGLRPF